MANHKSAEKRSRQNTTRRARNKAIRSGMKSEIKKVVTAVEENNVEKAQEALKMAIKVIDKTASRGTIHKKNASRKISRLSKRVHMIANKQSDA